MTKTFIFILFLLSCCLDAYSQTNVSAGNVSGTWTRSGSPYKVNGNVVVPNGQTLSIEPGVRVEFAQGSYMKVDGRLLAAGRSGSTDSIWFTKLNTRDTGSWRGIKFLSPAASNDTSVFRYCVFSYTKGIYDTTWYKLSGALTISSWSKVKVNNCTFYKNEACVGSSIFLTRGSHCSISSCTFKNNLISIFAVRDGSGWRTILPPRGSCIAVEYKSRAIVDSSVFKDNKKGKSYNYPFDLITASVIDVRGSYYYKVSAYMTLSNSLFDNNEGVVFCVDLKGESQIQSCSFINSPAGKSFAALYSGVGSKLYSSLNKITGNSLNEIIFVQGGNFYSTGDLIANNRDFIAIIDTEADNGISGYSYLRRGKVLNNSYLSSSPTGLGITVNKMFNCLIANNKMDVMVCAEMMSNNTIVNNHCDFSVLAIQRDAYFRNNIVWGNRSDTAKGRQIWMPMGIKASFYHNLIQGDTSSFFLSNQYFGSKPSIYVSNIDADPKFVNPTLGDGTNYNAFQADFRLTHTCQAVSPAINAGDADTFGIGSLDLNLSERFNDGFIDIGAYEDQSGPNQVTVIRDLVSDTLCQGEDAWFKLSARAMGLKREWQSSADGVTQWRKVNGSEDIDSLQLVQPAMSSSGTFYRVVLSGTCDQDTSTVAQLKINSNPDIRLGKDTSICKGETLNKSLSLSGSYVWQDGSHLQSMCQRILKDTVWSLNFTDSNGCKSSDTLRIKAEALPVLDLGPDFNLHRLRSVIVDAGPHQTYFWDNGSNSRTRTFFGYELGEGDHQIWVKVSNSFGCVDSDTVKVTVFNNSGLDAMLNSGITIYPSPFTLTLSIESVHDGVLRIYSSEGRWLQSSELKAGECQRLTTEDWAVGSYVLLVTTSTGETHILKVQKIN